MKSHIKTSTFDLFDVWQAMKHAITNQLKELKHVRVSQQIRLPLDVSGVLFEAKTKSELFRWSISIRTGI
ncbi:hypothetical protein HRG_014781 [Hirsutella rhossiliensis]